MFTPAIYVDWIRRELQKSHLEPMQCYIEDVEAVVKPEADFYVNLAFNEERAKAITGSSTSRQTKHLRFSSNGTVIAADSFPASIADRIGNIIKVVSKTALLVRTTTSSRILSTALLIAVPSVIR